MTVNCTYHNLKHVIKEEGINKKKDYSYTSCQKIAKFNKGTNTYRFWKFYQIIFVSIYQANSVI